MEYPFSPDEHAAVSRYISGIRKQLQEASDLFAARYGKDSNVAEIAVKTLVCATLLEHELQLLDEGHVISTDHDVLANSGAVEAVAHAAPF